jgi:hypothetical protein
MGDLHDAERNEPMHVDDSPKLAADHIIKDGGKSMLYSGIDFPDFCDSANNNGA